MMKKPAKIFSGLSWHLSAVLIHATVFTRSSFFHADAYEDGFTLLELCRKYYREAGLDVRQLDLLVR